MVRVLRPPTQHNKLSLPSYTFADNLLRFSCVPQLRVVDSLPSVTGLNIKVTRSSGRFPLLGACSPVCSAQGYPQEELEKGWALAPVLTLLDCLPLAGLMQDRSLTLKREPLFGKGRMDRMWHMRGYRSTDCIEGLTKFWRKAGPRATNTGCMLRKELLYPWFPTKNRQESSIVSAWNNIITQSFIV